MENVQVREILASPLGTTEINGKTFPNSRIIERMLLALYHAQAFYKAHENFLSSVASWLKRTGSISEKQLLAVAKTLPAYADTLATIAQAKASGAPSPLPQPRTASATPPKAQDAEAEREYREYKENRRLTKVVKPRAPKAKKRPLVLGADGLTPSERAFKKLCEEQFGLRWNDVPEAMAQAS